MYGALWGMWGVGHGWLWSGAPLLTFFSLGLIVLGLWLVISPA